MPRFAKITAEQERADLEARFNSARFLYVHSSFWIHERDESPDREPCSCCGSMSARLVRVEDDLRIIVDTVRRQRWNSWDNHTDKDRRRFDALAAKAQAYGTPRADVWDVPIRFTCSEEAAAQIRDDKTRVIYWSGGVRSSKSHTAAQWWIRGWLLHGGENELFWLAAPQANLAFRLMQRIFWGRGSTDSDNHQRSPSIAPKYRDPATGVWRSMIATGLPAHEQVRNTTFYMVDGSIVELRHVNRATGLVGDTVRRICYDEAVEANGPDGYKELVARVSQGAGQLGIASIPGEEKAWWLYDAVVGPVEAGLATDKKVHTVPQTANLWLSTADSDAYLESIKEDQEEIDRRFFGKWSKAGGSAYSQAWKPEIMALDNILNAELPQSWGFQHDVTKQIGRGLFGAKGGEIEYLGARDFNWRPQTGLVARVFAHDPRDKKTWHLVILDEHLLMNSDAHNAANHYVNRFPRAPHTGKYAKSGLVCDANGFYVGHLYNGVKSKTTDALEFERQGCLVCPPDYTTKTPGGKGKGNQPMDPPTDESKTLIRKLMREGRFLVNASKCPNLLSAIPRVRVGSKPASDRGTAHDSQVNNLDDCIRYLAWAIFKEETLPPAPPRQAATGFVL